jgi:hypothetical protein
MSFQGEPLSLSATSFSTSRLDFVPTCFRCLETHSSAHLPLWSAGVSLLHEVSARSGVNTEIGPALYKIFQDAGFPAPNMRLEMELGHDPDFTRWVSDFC